MEDLAETTSRRAKRAERVLGILPFVVIAALITAVLVAVVIVRSSTTNDTVARLDANHDTSVCVVKLFYDLSQASGTTPEERAARFDETFQRENLKTTCNMTDADVDRILD